MNYISQRGDSLTLRFPDNCFSKFMVAIFLLPKSLRFYFKAFPAAELVLLSCQLGLLFVLSEFVGKSH